MGSARFCLSSDDINHATKASVFAIAGGGIFDILSNVLNIASVVSPSIAPYVPHVTSILGAIVGIFAHRWSSDTTTGVGATNTSETDSR